MSALDPFDYCPCGSGKKVKFCCGKELAAELGKIERMLDGDQRLAALQETERLLAKHPGHAALMNYRALLRLAAAGDPLGNQAIEELVAAHPDLASGYVYRALARLPENLPGALDDLQQALSRVQGIHERDAEAPPPEGLSQALEAVIMALVGAGHYLSSLALLRAFPSRDAEGRLVQNPTLLEMQRSIEIPLLFKEPLVPPSAEILGQEWSSGLMEALTSAQGGAWLAGLVTLETLAAQHPQAPTLRRYIGLLQAYLLRTEDAVRSLRQFAGMSGAEADDALEAEALAQLLDPAGEKDAVEQITLTYAVTDASALQERLLSDKRAESVPFHPQMTAEGEPPPKGIFQILDRALPATGVAIAREAVPSFLGTAVLFGKETDREARLEFTTLRTDDFSAKIAQLRIMCGDFLAGQQGTEEVEGRMPLTQALRVPRWRFPADTPPALVRKLSQDYERENFAPRWINTKLAVLGGRTPRETAADPSTKLRAAAAVLRVELERAYERETSLDFNIIRGQLGIPPLAPIEIAGEDVYFVPLTRLRRAVTAKLSDQDLWAVTSRAFASGQYYLAGQTALELSRRESAQAQYGPGIYRVLVSVTPADADEALDYLQKYRTAEQAAGGSGVESLFLEIQLRRARREPEQLMQTLNTIQRKHMREPGVGQRLANLLVQLGLLHPDGTPVHGPPQDAMPEQAVAAAPAADAGKLWTPGGEAAGEKPKLWVPGME